MILFFQLTSPHHPFIVVDKNPTLSPVQKFNYLNARLNGEAKRVVAGFPLTGDNYVHSVHLLKERFGQPQKLVNAHTQALLDLQAPTNELSSLQFFHDSMETHIRGLLALGETTESYGTLLVPIILAKLPAETRRNIARGHTSLHWSIDQLQEAILKEIQIFEVH